MFQPIQYMSNYIDVKWFNITLELQYAPSQILKWEAREGMVGMLMMKTVNEVGHQSLSFQINLQTLQINSELELFFECMVILVYLFSSR